jgi:hypothetical protein
VAIQVKTPNLDNSCHKLAYDAAVLLTEAEESGGDITRTYF